jgi:hypothetical protein
MIFRVKDKVGLIPHLMRTLVVILHSQHLQADQLVRTSRGLTTRTSHIAVAVWGPAIAFGPS